MSTESDPCMDQSFRATWTKRDALLRELASLKGWSLDEARRHCSGGTRFSIVCEIDEARGLAYGEVQS